MNTLLNKIFRRIAGKSGDPDETAQIHLAVFGKHPGWDDHIEDLGLETECLVSAKRMLYIQGIGGNIDSGTWNELAEVQQLDGFRHLFVWRLAGELLLGRMWSSSDGKGRTRYPMITVAQCRRLPLSWALSQVLPRLEVVQSRCTQTESAAEVQNIVNRVRAELRQTIYQVPPVASPPAVSVNPLAQLADYPEMGPDHQGLLRVLYQIERNLAPYRRGRANADADAGAALIRVPKCAENPDEAFSLWIQFLLELIEEKTSILALLPINEAWLDLIVGEPPDNELYCVRAAPQALPLTTQIPYHLDDEFIERTRRLIEKARSPAD